jgi:hypothetical protein
LEKKDIKIEKELQDKENFLKKENQKLPQEPYIFSQDLSLKKTR